MNGNCKYYTIAEKVILPDATDMVNVMLNPEEAKLYHYDTISRRINEIDIYINNQTMENIKLGDFFVIQLDESIDVLNLT